MVAVKFKEDIPDSNCMEGYVGPRADLDVVATRKSLESHPSRHAPSPFFTLTQAAVGLVHSTQNEYR
jgi:hypothetical protein